jgi:sporulation protein YlmC with PRC-barrel domain
MRMPAESRIEVLRQPFGLSDLIGKPVYDGSGRRLGRAYEVRAHWEDEGMVIDEVLLGRGSLLKRLRGPEASSRGVPWENLIEVGERIVVHI